MSNAKRPTIARIWRGRVRRDRADEYEKYNYDVGIVPLIEKALGVRTFRDESTNDKPASVAAGSTTSAATAAPGTTIYCRNCGRPNPSDSKFCANCGQAL